jgi:hypothetical protein
VLRSDATAKVARQKNAMAKVAGFLFLNIGKGIVSLKYIIL